MADEEESNLREIWRISTYVITAFTLLLNLIILVLVIAKRSFKSEANFAILLIGLADLGYGSIVLPFMVDNYINNDWNYSDNFCRFFTFFFTFHDIFLAILLVTFSFWIALKFSDVDIASRRGFSVKYLLVAIALASIVFSLPATINASVFQERIGDKVKQECRTSDVYSMLFFFGLGSSMLFCITMAFLFSLCILGSPLLKTSYDIQEHNHKWRLMLTFSIVNILMIICGFPLNFKEVLRFLYKCCSMKEIFTAVNTTLYDVWSFLLLGSASFLRPGVFLIFYHKYLVSDETFSVY